MAGSEQNQKMKNETKSAVVVPESSENVLGMLSRSYDGRLANTSLRDTRISKATSLSHPPSFSRLNGS